MASTDDVYRKFGMAAEAAQLLETELGTLLIGVRGLEHDWHITPDPEVGAKVVTEINSHTLGTMLKRLQGVMQIDVHFSSKLTSALKARNRLMHGFYERHNFKIHTDAGRDAMLVDLEALHQELFDGWQLASAMSNAFLQVMFELKDKQVRVAKDQND